MLDFVNKYYEVTEDNKDTLYRLMVAEDIRKYSGDNFNLDELHVGCILGNIVDDNPKRTGKWLSRMGLSHKRLQKVTTQLPIPMIIE